MQTVNLHIKELYVLNVDQLLYLKIKDSGMEQLVAYQFHMLMVASSSLAPVTLDSSPKDNYVQK